MNSLSLFRGCSLKRGLQSPLITITPGTRGGTPAAAANPDDAAAAPAANRPPTHSQLARFFSARGDSLERGFSLDDQMDQVKLKSPEKKYHATFLRRPPFVNRAIRPCGSPFISPPVISVIALLMTRLERTRKWIGVSPLSRAICHSFPQCVCPNHREGETRIVYD